MIWLERDGWIANFDLAASGALPEGRTGREFSDSEVYKTLEAMAWEIGRAGRCRPRDAAFAPSSPASAAAQEADGYLNTASAAPASAARWSDLEWGHELYCFGHLFQAAVARARTRPDADDGLLEVARAGRRPRVRRLRRTAGSSPSAATRRSRRRWSSSVACTGEPALSRAGARCSSSDEVTDVSRDIECGRAYYQDDMPGTGGDSVLRGHAVRAGYLSAGAVDVAVEQGDDELLEALATQWENTVARRTYITGGQGSHHQDEAFGDDWMLPPDRAYSETCAAVASVMFSWRLLLARGLPQYADLIERTLYNVLATSPSHDGTAFYYANTLHQRRPGAVPRRDEPCPRASSSLRAPWFAVSCCPPNIARTLASLASYVATADDDGVQLHQYAPALIRTLLPDGRVVALDVQTKYPDDGAIRITVQEDGGSPWTLTLRVPAWAGGAELVETTAEGETQSRPVGPGTVTVTRAFRAGDVVELRLPVEPRFTAADHRIDAVRGCLAVERGPEVLCLESVDLLAASRSAVGDVAGVTLEAGVAPKVVDGRVVVRVRRTGSEDRSWPFTGPEVGAESEVDDPGFDVPLVPYHDWANRGPSTMRVWIPLAGA